MVELNVKNKIKSCILEKLSFLQIETKYLTIIRHALFICYAVEIKCKRTTFGDCC